MKAQEIFKAPYIKRSPKEIALIREALGESFPTWADRFKLSVSEVKKWELPEESNSHREPGGPEGLLLYWAAIEAKERGCAKGNLIRMASRYGKGE